MLIRLRPIINRLHSKSQSGRWSQSIGPLEPFVSLELFRLIDDSIGVETRSGVWITRVETRSGVLITWVESGSGSPGLRRVRAHLGGAGVGQSKIF